MDAADRGQVTKSAADVYEEFFVPALFGQWAARVSDAAKITGGQRVLDVACGTGVLAREVENRARPGGEVVGLDCNEGMLMVASRVPSQIEWRLGQAESLPFSDRHFDAVVSQFGLMFFDDREKALQEMWRVLRPGGSLAVAVWDDLAHAAGYAAMVGLLKRLFGDRIADALRAPYALGDPDRLLALFVEAGIADPQVTTLDGVATFPSIEDWVHTDVKGWTLADMIDDAQYRELAHAARRDLATFVLEDGTVRFSHPAHIVTAKKR